MLRVISGKYSGRKLNQPNLKITRPTTDRTKEAVFSMIQFKISGSIFLDLFSGSGSIGIEACSRGAMKAILVENNSDAMSVIRDNIKTLKLSNILTVKMKVDSYLSGIKGTKFDFIYMDPPYDGNMYNDTILLIKKIDILKENGLLIIETSNPDKIKIPNGFVIQKSKKYGKSSILVIGNNI